MSKEGKYVPKRKAQEMRKEMPGLFRKVLIDFKEEKGLSFTIRIVGSSKRNMIVKFGDSKYDTDYQLELQPPKKCTDVSPDIRATIFELLRRHKPSEWNIENSTSVITLHKRVNGVDVHSFDIAVLKGEDNNSSKSAMNKITNQYSWEKIGKLNKAYVDFREDYATIGKLTKEIYLEKRQNRHDEINDDKDHKDYKSSSSLFLESVNEAKQKTEKK